MLENLSDAMMQMDSSGMMMMISPMAKSFIGDIDAFAQSTNFNTSEKMSMEMTYGIQMNDGRSGLLGLITDSDNSSVPPIVLDDTTLYYFTMDIDFKGLSNQVITLDLASSFARLSNSPEFTRVPVPV